MPGNEVDRWYIMIYTTESIVYCSYQALVDQFLSEASFVSVVGGICENRL